MEYARLEPFGQLRDNWHMAVIASILASAYRDPKKQAAKFSDFFYTDEDTAREEKDKALMKFFSKLKPKTDDG